MKNRIFGILILSFAMIFCFALMLSSCNDASLNDDLPKDTLPNDDLEDENDHVATNDLPSTKGLIFEPYGEGYAVIGYEGEEGDVIIGELYNGLPILKIKEKLLRLTHPINIPRLSSVLGLKEVSFIPYM